MEVRVIDARPDHAGFLAWAMMTAFRSHLPEGMWDLYVGGTEADCLRFLQALTLTDERHWSHYSNHIIAEVDGRPASALCGYFEAECGSPHLLVGIAQANEATGRTKEDDAAGWERADSIIYCETDHVDGAWIVENVATLPEFRRRGLAEVLLADILARGRSRGAKVSEIGVMIGNDPAQRAYEKAGFAVVSEKLHPEFEAVYKCPGIRGMSREL